MLTIRFFFRKVQQWFRNNRSDKSKRTRRHIKEYYMPSFGKQRLKSSDDFDAELELFYSEDPANKEKVARILGGISQTLWRKEDPKDNDYIWLRDMVILNKIFALFGFQHC